MPPRVNYRLQISEINRTRSTADGRWWWTPVTAISSSKRTPKTKNKTIGTKNLICNSAKPTLSSKQRRLKFFKNNNRKKKKVNYHRVSLPFFGATITVSPPQLLMNRVHCVWFNTEVIVIVIKCTPGPAWNISHELHCNSRVKSTVVTEDLTTPQSFPLAKIKKKKRKHTESETAKTSKPTAPQIKFKKLVIKIIIKKKTERRNLSLVQRYKTIWKFKFSESLVISEFPFS